MGVNGGSWLYSFVYNGAYCIPNIIICTPVMILIAKVYPAFLEPKEQEKVDAKVITDEPEEISEFKEAK